MVKAESEKSLAAYLKHVVINAPTPATFGRIGEPWQWELVAHKIPMLESLAGLRQHPGPWSFCDILARGHDKTTLEGRLATWLLLASKRPIQGYILAEDKDQGALVLDSMVTEAKLNPWVWESLTVTKNMIRGPGGVVEVVPADAGSAYGFRGNLYIFDEWCNWRKPKCQDVWTAVYSGTEKIFPRVLGVVSNAGYRGTWQWEVYKTFRENPDFVVWDRPGALASWMNPERIKALAKGMSPVEVRRLFGNEWVDVGEELGYLTLDEALACVDEALMLRMARRPGVDNHVIVCDYGPKRDRTVIGVFHSRADGTVVVDRMDTLLGGTCTTEELYARLDNLCLTFKPRRVVIDPHQTLGVIERLRQRHHVEEVQFRGGKLNNELADTLRTAVSQRIVRWYPGCGRLTPEDTLELELARLVTTRKAYGYRFDHEATGHDDRAFVLALGVKTALEELP